MSFASRIIEPHKLGIRLVLGLLALLPCASADAPSVAFRVEGGAPRALAAAARLNAASTCHSKVELPQHAALGWRQKLEGPVLSPPSADEHGRLTFVHGTGRLSQIDAKGHVTWSLRYADEVGSSPSIVDSEGNVWIVTHKGEVAAFDPEGRRRFSRTYPDLISNGSVRATPLAMGGAALGVGRRAVIATRTGTLILRTELPENIYSMVADGSTPYAITMSGKVFGPRGESRFAELGSFGGRVGEVGISPSTHELIATTDNRELVALDPLTGARRTVFADAALTLSVFAMNSESLRLFANGSLLVGASSKGQELFRTPLGTSPGEETQGPPPPLIDDAGTTALITAGVGLWLVTPQGEAQLVSESACPDPLRPTPVGPRALVLTCGSGLVFSVRAAAPTLSGKAPSP